MRRMFTSLSSGYVPCIPNFSPSVITNNCFPDTPFSDVPFSDTSSSFPVAEELDDTIVKRKSKKIIHLAHLAPFSDIVRGLEHVQPFGKISLVYTIAELIRTSTMIAGPVLRR